LNLSYGLRLALSCLAAFFLLNFVLTLAVRLFAPAVLARSGQCRADHAARILFALRLVPAGLAVLTVACLCVPSYLWLEPPGQVERTSVGCLIAAVAGAAVWTASAVRALRAIAGYRAYLRGCRGARRETILPGHPHPVWLVEHSGSHVALAGVLRPRLVISDAVVCDLPPDELAAVLRHERAHETSRDNLKRLCLLLAPDALPGLRGLAKLESAWARLTEWAADDAASAGSEQQALCLASALVRVARMNAGLRPPLLATSFLGNGRDVGARVDRLLGAERPQTPLRPPAAAVWAGASMAAFLVVAMLDPAVLHAAHRLMEKLIE